MENWKPIEGASNYEVSDKGRARRINYRRPGAKKILKPAPDKKGYLRVTIIMDDGRRVIRRMHRLVAIAFIPNPDNKPDVNHINADKQDNDATNLEWVTCIENNHHAIQHGLYANSFAAGRRENEKRMIPVVSIDRDGNRRTFPSISEAGRQLGIHRRHIQSVLKGERKHAKGQKFEYADRG